VLEYNPINDSWVQKNNFPGNRRCDASAFSTNTNGYFGMGRVWNSGPYVPLSDIWEYDHMTDTWALKTNHPNGSNFWVTYLVHNNDIFIGGGGQPTTNLIMKYNPQSNLWNNITNLPNYNHASIGFSNDCNIFICSGYNSGGNSNQIFKLKVDSLCLEASILEVVNNISFNIYPNPFTSETTLYSTDDLQNATLIIYSYSGQEIKQINNISGQSYVLNCANLPSGLYFIRLLQDSKLIATDKIVITE
jgi:hypothetical protein